MKKLLIAWAAAACLMAPLASAKAAAVAPESSLRASPVAEMLKPAPDLAAHPAAVDADIKKATEDKGVQVAWYYHWHRHYWHRHYWHYHYWHRTYYWRPHYHYWHRHYWHRHYW